MNVMRTLRLKVKRESYAWLEAAAREVNQVWNYCNETSAIAATRTDSMRTWLGGHDLCGLTAGAANEFDRIGSATIQSICAQYASRRRMAKRLRLKWRVSVGSRKSLGWIPFKAEALRASKNRISFCGKVIRVFDQKSIAGLKWGGGCFSADSVGDWWLCLPIDRQDSQNVAPHEIVGIDLGLKAIATTSDGEVLEAGRWERRNAARLADAQRRGHKRQAKRIHRRTKRQRADALHKFSRSIVNQYQNIIVGDVSSSRLAKTNVARSVMDAGWATLRNLLDYKSQQAARSFQIVNENYTTRACSNCGQHTGPKGIKQLAVRRWQCSACGAEHDRDVNAARNIANVALRHQRPSAGTSQNTRHECLETKLRDQSLLPETPE